MSNKEKVSELLVHYLHTIPEQGDADEVAEIVELIYRDMHTDDITMVAIASDYADNVASHSVEFACAAAKTAERFYLILYWLWAIAFCMACFALYRTF